MKKLTAEDLRPYGNVIILSNFGIIDEYERLSQGQWRVTSSKGRSAKYRIYYTWALLDIINTGLYGYDDAVMVYGIKTNKAGVKTTKLIYKRD